jgi:hypothetical protein
MNNTDTQLVLAMACTLVSDPECFWVETEGMALALGSPHPAQVLSVIDTNHGTVLHLHCTPHEFIDDLCTHLRQH